MQPVLWLVGDWQHADFHEAHAWLQSNAACALRSSADHAVSAEPLRAPHAIVLAQSRPGQINAREVERWHAAAPLARLAALLGPWCEGEGRTGRPWPGVVRVPWRCWQARLPSAVGLAAESMTPAWQPRTATEWERIVGNVQDSKRLRFRGNVQVHTASLATFRSWEGSLGRMGLKSTWICGEGDIPASWEIAFFDGWQSVPQGELTGGRSGCQWRVLVLDWPRPEDASRAKSLGFCAVLGQPLLFGDLAAVLASLLRANVDRQERVA